MTQPEKKFRAGAVSATVWLNKATEGEYRSVNLERSYMGKDGKWQTTSSFRASDLPKADLVLRKAYEFISLDGGNE